MEGPSCEMNLENISAGEFAVGMYLLSSGEPCSGLGGRLPASSLPSGISSIDVKIA